MKQEFKKNRSKKLRYLSDFDYLHLLSEDELELIISFNKAYYQSNTRHLESLVGELSPEFKKECYRNNYGGRNDIMNCTKTKSYTEHPEKGTYRE